MRTVAMSVACVIGIFTTQAAQADFFIHHWEDHMVPDRSLRLAPGLIYYTSASNYLDDGAPKSPSGLQRYSRQQMDVLAEYSLAKLPLLHALTAYGRVSWSRAQVEHDVSPGDIFGLADQTLGLAMRLKGPDSHAHSKGFEALSLDLQLQLDFPAYDNNRAVQTGSPFLGDGSVDLTLGGFAAFPLYSTEKSRWVMAAGAGFTHRGGSFSSAIPWNLSFQYLTQDTSDWPEARNEGFFASATFFGIQSLKTDPLLGTPGFTRTSPLAGAGGSTFINAINPTLVTARVLIGYQLSSQLGISSAVSQTLTGQNSPSGFTLTLGVQARWPDHGLDSSHLSPEDYGKANRGLVHYGLDSRVLKANDRLNVLKIDKGSQDGVQVGQLFDIFSKKMDGSLGEAIGRARCTHVKLDEAALSMIEYFKQVAIQEGFVAKRPLD